MPGAPASATGLSLAPFGPSAAQADVPGANTLSAPSAPVAPAVAPDPIQQLLAVPATLINAAVNFVVGFLEPIIGPGAPFYNAALWGVLEATRRESNRSLANQTPSLTVSPLNSQDFDDNQVHGTFTATDPDGDALTVSVPTGGVGAPAHGAVTIDQTAGTFTYTPNTGYTGPDAFTLTVSDASSGFHVHPPGQTDTSTATVTVTVTPAVPVNHAPVAVNDSYSTAQDTPLTIAGLGLLLNDTDADGDALTAALASGPAYGTATVNTDGSFTYTPAANFNGADSFTYTASDGIVTSAAATVSLTVTPAVPVNQPPVVTDPPPPSHPDPDSGEVSGSLGIVDPDGDPLTITYVEGGAPKYGAVAFDPIAGTYVYTPNQAGQLRAALGLGDTDSFTVLVTQGDQQPVAPMMFAARFASFAAPASFAVSDDGVSTLAATGDGFQQQVTIPQIPIQGANLVVDGNPVGVGNGPAGIVVTDAYAYVLNTGDNDGEDNSTYNGSVTVIDTSDNHVVSTLAVGQLPKYAAVNGTYVYVANGIDGTLSVIDTATNTVVDTISVAPSSIAPAVSPDGTRLYITHLEADPLANPAVHSVYVVDIDPDSPTFNTVVDTDATTPEIDPIIVGGGAGVDISQPNDGLAFNADGTRLYIVRFNQSQVDGQFVVGGDVVVIDTDPGSQTYNQVIGDPIPLGKYAGLAGVSGNRLYVATMNFADLFTALSGGVVPPGTLTVIDIDPASPTYNTVIDLDPATPEVDRIAVSGAGIPLNIAISPDGSLAYTVDIGQGMVTVIDLIANQALDLNPATPEVDGFVYDSDPQGAFNQALLAVSPDGTKLYISNPSKNTVTAVTIG